MHALLHARVLAIRVGICYNYTSHRGMHRGLDRNRPSTSVQDQDCTIEFKEEEFNNRKLRNNPKLQVRTVSSSSDALTTELLEVLWRSGSEFSYNYTSHRGLHRGLARNSELLVRIDLTTLRTDFISLSYSHLLAMTDLRSSTSKDRCHIPVGQ